MEYSVIIMSLHLLNTDYNDNSIHSHSEFSATHTENITTYMQIQICKIRLPEENLYVNH